MPAKVILSPLSINSAEKCAGSGMGDICRLNVALGFHGYALDLFDAGDYVCISSRNHRDARKSNPFPAFHQFRKFRKQHNTYTDNGNHKLPGRKGKIVDMLKVKKGFSAVFDHISECMAPIIPIVLAGGILKMVVLLV